MREAFNQPGLLGLLFVTLFLFAVIVGGIWALTRKAKVSAITSAHPYRRQRTVLVAVERRKGSRAPVPTYVHSNGEAMTATQMHEALKRGETPGRLYPGVPS